MKTGHLFPGRKNSKTNAMTKFENITPSRSCVKLFDDEKVNWRRAKALCVASGAKLVEVTSPRENDFLKSLRSMKGFT